MQAGMRTRAVLWAPKQPLTLIAEEVLAAVGAQSVPRSGADVIAEVFGPAEIDVGEAETVSGRCRRSSDIARHH
eukprot:5146286-Amphidinium_carterae.1